MQYFEQQHGFQEGVYVTRTVGTLDRPSRTFFYTFFWRFVMLASRISRFLCLQFRLSAVCHSSCSGLPGVSSRVYFASSM
jgi:hypothetical protein